MPDLRFGMIGAGFWSAYQLAGWRELEGAKCVAVCNRTRDKAEKLAARCGVPAVFDDPRRMLDECELDFVDVVTDVGAHAEFVQLAAAHKKPVVCQKPLARTLAEAQSMVATCRTAGVPLLVNENFRWQTPLRAVREVLISGRIGQVFRARVQFNCSFPVFDNQPSLGELEQFILTDVGTHTLDVARFLFGEPESVYCRICRVNPTIRGEDVATVILGLADDVTVICELSYASRTEHERFPETFILAEGTKGSLELAGDYGLRVTTREGTVSRRVPPPRYDWADPAYDVVHASIVDCQRNLLAHLAGTGVAETTGEDNLRTLRLVFAAYESAASGQVVAVGGED